MQSNISSLGPRLRKLFLLEQFPGNGCIYAEPLELSRLRPWNYPFHLIISPLVGAIAAGTVPFLNQKLLLIPLGRS